MTAQTSRQVHLASIPRLRRRQGLTGLLAGAAASLRAPAGIGEAKRKKKKKKYKKLNSCPQRVCCTCWDPNTFVDVLCGYIAGGGSFIADCMSFCQGHALAFHQASGAVADQANYCAHDLKCVRLDCPVT